MKKSTGQPNKYIAGDFPHRIEIELSGVCNLRCTYCPRKYLDAQGGFIDLAIFKKIIDEAASYPDTVLVLHRRGESLMHPDFSLICDYVKGKFKEVQLATNATLLDEERSRAIIEGVSFISFSIDTPENFQKTRVPAQYPQVESNILKFLELNKGRVKTQVSMVKTALTPEKDPEIFKRIWSERVNWVRIYEEHSRDGKFGSLGNKREGRLPCVMPFYELLIFFDGSVGRCNHDWNGSPLGNVSRDSIKKIWLTDAYLDLRRQHEKMELSDPVCKNCDCWYPQAGNQGTGERIKNEK